MKKGFVRILEAIIASIILLAAVSYFFIIEPQYSEWDIALIQTRAEDALASLDNNGTLKMSVRRNDPGMLYNNLSRIFPRSVNFQTYIENRVYPAIFVSYIGDTPTYDEIFRTSPVAIKFKNRNIPVTIDRPPNIESVNPKTNVLFIAGIGNLPADKEKIAKFLKNGSIILFSDLSESDFLGTKKNILSEVFGLSWKSSVVGDVYFYDQNNVNKISFIIANHFENLTGLERTHKFTGLHDNNGIEIDNRTIISSTRSLVKVNYDILDGRGRVVWFARYDFSDPDKENVKAALNATLLWAASERYDFNPPGSQSPPGNVPVYEYKYFVYDQEPYSVNIRVWQVFY